MRSEFLMDSFDRGIAYCNTATALSSRVDDILGYDISVDGVADKSCSGISISNSIDDIINRIGSLEKTIADIQKGMKTLARKKVKYLTLDMEWETI